VRFRNKDQGVGDEKNNEIKWSIKVNEDNKNIPVFHINLQHREQ